MYYCGVADNPLSHTILKGELAAKQFGWQGFGTNCSDDKINIKAVCPFPQLVCPVHWAIEIPHHYIFV